VPISLSDDELASVMDGARPLAPHDRDDFLRAIAHQSARQPELGRGVVHRLVREPQRLYFDPQGSTMHWVRRVRAARAERLFEDEGDQGERGRRYRGRVQTVDRRDMPIPTPETYSGRAAWREKLAG